MSMVGHSELCELPPGLQSVGSLPIASIAALFLSNHLPPSVR